MKKFIWIILGMFMVVLLMSCGDHHNYQNKKMVKIEKKSDNKSKHKNIAKYFIYAHFYRFLRP